MLGSQGEGERGYGPEGEGGVGILFIIPFCSFLSFLFFIFLFFICDLFSFVPDERLLSMRNPVPSS